MKCTKVYSTCSQYWLESDVSSTEAVKVRSSDANIKSTFVANNKANDESRDVSADIAKFYFKPLLFLKKKKKKLQCSHVLAVWSFATPLLHIHTLTSGRKACCRRIDRSTLLHVIVAEARRYQTCGRDQPDAVTILERHRHSCRLHVSAYSIFNLMFMMSICLKPTPTLLRSQAVSKQTKPHPSGKERLARLARLRAHTFEFYVFCEAA
jgi:hypothetical protein